jgi:outer membrane protein OmpA-like peptidoglycan-associated protein
MLHEEYERHSTSSLEEKKSNPPEKDFVAFDFQAKTLNMSEFQTLLQTADNLLQKNQIKEAIKLYEHSIFLYNFV